ncbi:MAG: GntR family transcriptional regulator [Rhodobacteraceae bacterium]|nr:MAG: GntR family transcriptional regulator [Paracoccaceae bacterium]
MKAAAIAAAPDYGRSPAPRYLQVAAAIRRRIEDGAWRPNEQISTLAELEAEFGVARVTVRQAIELLENEGLLRRVQGKGTFVASEVEDRRWLRLDLRWRTIAETIGRNVPRFLPAATPPPPPPFDEGDGPRAAPYRYLESVQSRRGQPFSYARVHVSEEIVALAPERFAAEPTIAVLATLPDLTVTGARQSFVVGAADTRIAEMLKIGLGSPTVEAHLVVNDGAGRAIYVADVVYRGDCVRLDVDLLG